jgi:MFS transporter, DHA2 family, multidrug resistance protein
MTPLSAIAMVGIASAEAGAAWGRFNMMRNLGGAIGTAAVETFFYQARAVSLVHHQRPCVMLEPATPERIADLQQYFLKHGAASAVDPQLLSGNLQQFSAAWHQAVIAVGNAIRAQATIMGYADCFASARHRAARRHSPGGAVAQGRCNRRGGALNQA